MFNSIFLCPNKNLVLIGLNRFYLVWIVFWGANQLNPLYFLYTQPTASINHQKAVAFQELLQIFSFGKLTWKTKLTIQFADSERNMAQKYVPNYSIIQ